MNSPASSPTPYPGDRRNSRSDTHSDTQTGRQDHPLAFFRGFLKKPKEVGSVIPSSRFLERRVARSAGLGDAKVVVELGPGTGGTTRAFLRHMRPEARLLAIEINGHFARLLEETIDDERLIVVEGNALDMRAALEEHGLGAPDVVLSGIPFSTMKREEGLGVIRAVHEILPPGGRFVAYQVRDRVSMLGREVMGRPEVQFEPRNVPPMRVYRWRK